MNAFFLIPAIWLALDEPKCATYLFTGQVDNQDSLWIDNTADVLTNVVDLSAIKMVSKGSDHEDLVIVSKDGQEAVKVGLLVGGSSFTSTNIVIESKWEPSVSKSSNGTWLIKFK